MRPGDADGFLMRLWTAPTADVIRVIRRDPAVWAAATGYTGTPLLWSVVDRCRLSRYRHDMREHTAAIASELVRAGADPNLQGCTAN